MALRLGINGFGRIGRTALRVLMENARDDMQVVAINDPAPAETLAHLFEFDSTHGPYRGPLRFSEHGLDLGKGPMRMTSVPEPDAITWPDLDIVLECSGRFTDPIRARAHLKRGARRVLLSAPAKGAAKTIIEGVNADTIVADDLLISNGSCTTNCLVPIVKVLHDAFTIRRGMMTTVHCYTSNQSLHDAPHADLYRARGAAVSMIPTTTGAAQTLGEVLPDLAGRITGQAIRVPVPNVSCIDLSVEVAAATDAQAVNAAFRAAAQGALSGIVATTDRKLVSSDLKQAAASATLAEDQTRVQDGTWVRVLAWYDNEWGFSNRLLEVAARMGHLL
ncbi:type I glyceraldehyde-3-phosphate dehydrogenase [Roseobacter sinensis]|uniref:Type I glyceraldehyde-3-phosphate dehydrogenase n=1 Tax=Roseobacter sinensis TaxID=2931391 RepID=A0ABT3BC05_9RHOB|nr:type I glyceraldehyde-3-phosphate dehydrogenase [Roseobacter sp. WL0113]MCV3271099.1 type I glyceraldehyde-3-phosphate dehydrogenase [Roseobacter sp. WL0113]